MCDLKDRPWRAPKVSPGGLHRPRRDHGGDHSNSTHAEQMSVYVVRAFARIRESLDAHTVLARELATLRSRVDTLDADTRNQFDQVYEAILGLMSPGAKKQ